MTLATRGSLFGALLLAIFTIDLVLGLNTVREMHEFSRSAEQSYEAALVSRRLRSQLFAYHHAGLTAAITRDLDDRQDQELYRERLENTLREQPPVLLANTTLRADFADLRADILSLLEFEPGPPGSATHELPFLNPAYRRVYEGVVERLDALLARASRILERERLRQTRYMTRIFPRLLVIYLLSLGAIVVALWHVRRTVLAPLGRITDTIRRLQGGDLGARTEVERTDEIGEIASTLNTMSGQLERRRKDRVRFIRSVAHDLKNAVGAIRLNTDLALRRNGNLTVDQAVGYLEKIREINERTHRLTRDLARTAEETAISWSIEPRRFALAGLIEDVLASYRLAYPRYRFEWERDGEPPEINGDPDRLSQVLSNLLTNAVKYSPDASEITLHTSNRNGSVHVEVRDRGIGVPEDQIGELFQPFVRLENGRDVSTGSGLGLSIVKEIIEKHGGRVEARPRPGGGTVFGFDLPAPSESRDAG